MKRSLRALVDGALLVQYPEASDEEANAEAVRLAAALDSPPLPGLLDVVPGARTLFVAYDPSLLDAGELARRIDLAASDSVEHALPPRREHRIPVLYGGAAAPDLEEVARRAGLSPDEAARRHAAAVYRVGFLGFAPGFAYLTGLPPELAAPRRASPRPRVPGGTVAVAGPYSGIYPADGPGGWNLIGTAGAVLFDPLREPAVLFAPGDVVRFFAATEEEVEKAGRLQFSPHPGPLPGGEGEALFRVVSPGLWSGVCGAPRAGNGRLGAPPGGAMDRESLAAGNEALGNSSGAPALEIALLGPELEALEDCTVVLAGPRCDATRAGARWPSGEPANVRRGDRIRVTAVHEGVRAYLCVRGGFSERSVGPVARLAPGDLLRGELPATAPAREPRRVPIRGGAASDAMVRIVLGPQEDRFEEAGIATLLQSEYRVSPTSDRRGVRLEGPRLSYRDGASPEIPPEGTALGAIQVPGDGQPIVLGPDRPVTGGYAKVATVVPEDFPRIAQARPGSLVRFRRA